MGWHLHPCDLVAVFSYFFSFGATKNSAQLHFRSRMFLFILCGLDPILCVFFLSPRLLFLRPLALRCTVAQHTRAREHECEYTFFVYYGFSFLCSVSIALPCWLVYCLTSPRPDSECASGRNWIVHRGTPRTSILSHRKLS